jgi:hypothetical protein
MCNKCSFSFIPRGKLASLNNITTTKCPTATPTPIAQTVLNENYSDALVRIGEYVGIDTLLALALTSKSLYHTIHGASSEKFWKIMCESISSNERYEYSYLFCYNEDIYYLMPNVVCPDTYREYYFACVKKIKWLNHVKRNINQSFVEYLESYRNSNTSNFGALRLFSRISPVYIVYSDTTMSYSAIEEFITCNNSSRIERNHANRLTLYIYSSESGDAKVAVLYQSSDSDITFADVGYTVSLLTDRHIQAFKPHSIALEMPYEVYYIN